MAFGGVTVVVGLVTYQAIFIIGTILLLAAGGEWMAQAWAERASADSVHNADVRSRMANPFEFPIAGVVAIGIIVYSFSRIMLWLSKTNTVFAFAVLAGILLAFAFLFAYRPSIKARAMISIVADRSGRPRRRRRRGGHRRRTRNRAARDHRATGARGPVRGSRPHRGRRESLAGRRCHRQCRRSDHARRATGTLSYDVNGPIPEGDENTITLPRSSPNNVLFINHSDEDRRLSADMGTILVAGEDGNEVEEPSQACTTLVEPGGEQLITLNIPQPSFAFPDGFRFFVPGVETAELVLVVP